MSHSIVETAEPHLPARKEGRWQRWCRRYIRSFQENRISERKPSGTAAELRWTNEQGARIVVRGICVDRSERGMGLLCPVPLPGHAPVEVKLQPDGVVQSSRLRHCQKFGDAYLLGVEFVQ